MSAWKQFSRTPLYVVAFASCLIALDGPAQVKSDELQELRDAGRTILERDCASCHSIEPTGQSTLAIAPPMRTFASKWPLEYMEEALAEGIVSGHPEMPDNSYPPQDIAAILSYLAWLSTHPDEEAAQEQ